jgi:hypothetical protein
MSVYDYAEHPEFQQYFAKDYETQNGDDLQEKTTKFEYDNMINARLAKRTEAKYSVEFDYNEGKLAE